MFESDLKLKWLCKQLRRLRILFQKVYHVEYVSYRKSLALHTEVPLCQIKVYKTYHVENSVGNQL